LDSPEDFMACSISAYSGGDNRVEMNFPRFSFFGSIGLPTLDVSFIYQRDFRQIVSAIATPMRLKYIQG
jgi:hypothetical protein